MEDRRYNASQKRNSVSKDKRQGEKPVKKNSSNVNFAKPANKVTRSKSFNKRDKAVHTLKNAAHVR